MNQETNDFLKEELQEAHNTFHGIIKEMKSNGILYEYRKLEEIEMNSFIEINELINKMGYYVLESKNLKEDNSEMFNNEHRLCIKYLVLYGISLVFIKLYHTIFNTDDLDDMVKYIVGIFLGSMYMGLLCKDLYDNRTDTKDKRDLINKLKTMKEEYKDSHDSVVREINYIFALNDNLWDELDKGKKLVKSE